MERILRLSGVVNDSIVDGPGMRMTIFTQGCPHACPGCHNPETHDVKGGYIDTVERILEAAEGNPLLKGITLSGGEPFLQAESLVALCRGAHALKKDVWAYSGYTIEQLLAGAVPYGKQLLGEIDVLVDGKFQQELLDLSLWYRGSKNQRIIDVKKTIELGKIEIITFDE